MTKGEKPGLQVINDGELVLSRKALTELMKAVLETGHTFRFRARGWSMSPFIRDGDILCISPLNGRPPGLGVVVAYAYPLHENLAVHRVIGRKDSHWLILGDNTPDVETELVPYTCIIGKVTCVIQNDKKVWIGQGWERYLIAWLSRVRWLTPMVRFLRKIRGFGRSLVQLLGGSFSVWK